MILVVILVFYFISFVYSLYTSFVCIWPGFEFGKFLLELHNKCGLQKYYGCTGCTYCKMTEERAIKFNRAGWSKSKDELWQYCQKKASQML